MQADTSSIPAELASLLRNGLALAVHAHDGKGIFPDGAASVRGFRPVPELSREFAGIAATLSASGSVALVDLPLDGRGRPLVATACRILVTPDGERALFMVPADTWRPAEAVAGAAPAAPPPKTPGPHQDAMSAISSALRAHLDAPDREPAPRPAPAAAPASDAAFENSEPVRVLWQCDAAGTITQAGTRLQALLGAQSGSIAGKKWQDLAGDLFMDVEGALAQALAARSTASKIPLLWSSDHAPGPMEVEWSALPVFDRNREFQGYRGFLLVHPHASAIIAETAQRENNISKPPASQPQPQAPEAAPTLSQSEKAAFRELARALGARPVPETVAAPAAPAEPPQAEPDIPDAAAHTPEQSGQEGAAAPVTVTADVAEPAGAPQQDSENMQPPASAMALPEAGAVTDNAAGAQQETLLAQDISAPVPDAEAAVLPEPVVISSPVTHIVRVPDPRYLDMVERLPIGVLVNRSDRVLFANRTLLDLLDYNSVADIAEAGGTQALFRGRIPMSEKDGPSGALLLSARDGERISVDARLQNIHWDGEPATLVSFRRSAEIELGQKLRAAESELKSREAQLRETRAILDTTTDGVAVLDDTGRILSINRTAEALFGYDQKEMAGDFITELMAPESRSSVLDYFEGLKSGGVRAVLNDGREVTGRVRQGGRIPIFLSFGQLADKPEQKFCAVMRDLTAWKKSERELVDARKSAESASAQKSDFLAKISHEVRTPLNAIIGFAEVMMEERFGAVGNERYKEYLKDIHASGTHVISLVNDLLDLSKIEAGKMELDFTSVNINDVVRGAVSIMQPQSQRGRIVIRSAMTTKMPAIIADERALKQIILNLLSNAVKFTDPGGQVIVSTTVSDLGEVVIRVRDTGIGMTPAEVEQAMEPFKQVASGRRAGGTGLGLPLTKALVEANRAAMRISSVKNEGTLVEIVFPPTRVMADH